MKIFNNATIPRVYIVDGVEYEADQSNDIEVGKVLFDARSAQFKLLETPQDCLKFWNVDPDLYSVFRKRKHNKKMSGR